MLGSDRKYTVEKNKLLGILRENRTKHVATYDAAVIEYRKQCIAALAGELAHARDGVKFRMDFPELVKPRSFADSYDTAIGILELAEETSIPITVGDYESLVLDEWNWKAAFVGSTSNYVAAHER